MMNVKLRNLIALLVGTGMTVAGSTHASQADEAALDAIHKKIERDYTSVEHMTSDELTRVLSNPGASEDYVLFDVRETGEHAVSHLKGATQVKPGIWTSTFMRKHGDAIKGKTVVLYCSVGRRSSYAASYLQKALKKNGAKRVVNLKGGIFSWHNQKRDLSAGVAQTRFVHPYDNYWGRLIERKSLIRYKPATPAASDVSSSAATQTAQ